MANRVRSMMPLRSVAGSWKRCGRSPSAMAGKSAGGRHCRVKRDRPARMVRLLPSEALSSSTWAPSGSLRTISYRVCAGAVVEPLGYGEVHVGGSEAQSTLLRRDQDVGENGDRVAPLDHTLDMGQRLQKG